MHPPEETAVEALVADLLKRAEMGGEIAGRHLQQVLEAGEDKEVAFTQGRQGGDYQ